MKIYKLLIMLFLASISSGCAVSPQFNVDVDSISAPNKNIGKTYILLPGNEDVNESDLQYQEYASYAHQGLKAKGYTKSSSFQSADIAIFLSYGIGEPQTSQYTYSVPTWGQTGVSSSNTYGTLNTFGNTTTFSGTTTYTPSYGITGSTTHIGTQTTYFRYALLSALDLDKYRKSKETVQLWKTTISSTGSSGDLRQVFPILMVAGQNYLGENTGRKINLSIRESDPEVQRMIGKVN